MEEGVIGADQLSGQNCKEMNILKIQKVLAIVHGLHYLSFAR